MLKHLTLALAAATVLTGCNTFDHHTIRTEGVDPRAGNAVKANTVLQLVDPWPEGVEDTNLVVPAERAATETAAAPAAADDGGETE